jgi:hypothetical protein
MLGFYILTVVRMSSHSFVGCDAIFYPKDGGDNVSLQGRSD